MLRTRSLLAYGQNLFGEQTVALSSRGARNILSVCLLSLRLLRACSFDGACDRVLCARVCTWLHLMYI